MALKAFFIGACDTQLVLFLGPIGSLELQLSG